MEVLTITGSSNQESVYVDDYSLRTRPYSEFDAAIEAGNAYSWSNLTYDPDAHDTILGVENNSSTQDLVIQEIRVSGDTATQFVVHTSSGVTMAGTAVTGVNLNRNSNNTASATAKADETGNGQQAASYTGRLFAGLIAADGTATIDVDGAIVLPNDHNIGVDFTTAATAGNITIIGYFRDRD